MILRVSEARDLGDVNRYSFYDATKTYAAAPPDVMRVNEKNLREYYVANVCGVIITSNYKSDGLYLPADDRRHYVAWSDLTAADFADGYWNSLWGWYGSGGEEDVAAYLSELDISGFDPKAPPPKTPAFWAIVDANRAPEEAELADVLDKLGRPDALTLTDVISEAGTAASRTGLRIARTAAPSRTDLNAVATCQCATKLLPTACGRSIEPAKWFMPGSNSRSGTDLPPPPRSSEISEVSEVSGFPL